MDNQKLQSANQSEAFCLKHAFGDDETWNLQVLNFAPNEKKSMYFYQT